MDIVNDVISTTGVTAREVDVVELHDCFSTNELITYEALVSHPALSLMIACPPLHTYNPGWSYMHTIIHTHTTSLGTVQ